MLFPMVTNGLGHGARAVHCPHRARVAHPPADCRVSYIPGGLLVTGRHTWFPAAGRLSGLPRARVRAFVRPACHVDRSRQAQAKRVSESQIKSWARPGSGHECLTLAFARQAHIGALVAGPVTHVRDGETIEVGGVPIRLNGVA